MEMSSIGSPSTVASLFSMPSHYLMLFTFSTDLKFPNNLWKSLVGIIDTLLEIRTSGSRKLRVYRKDACREYPKTTKMKREGVIFRKEIHKQLGYILRSLDYLEALSCEISIENLSSNRCWVLLIISKVFFSKRKRPRRGNVRFHTC